MRQINAAGLDIIKSFEKCELTAYQDSGGIWTIGWGHTGPEVVEGLVIDQAAADALLEADVATAENGVSRLVKCSLTDNQFSALVVFVFNVGVGEFKTSTMLSELNAGTCDISDQFDRWIHVNGQVLTGLVRRRQAEKELFLTA